MLRSLLIVGLADVGLLARPIHLCPCRRWCSRHVGSMGLYLQEHMHASAHLQAVR